MAVAMMTRGSSIFFFFLGGERISGWFAQIKIILQGTNCVHMFSSIKVQEVATLNSRQKSLAEICSVIFGNDVVGSWERHSLGGWEHRLCTDYQ